jgi:putative transposase
MPYRLIPFSSNYYYHIFNRGVEKRIIFSNDQDYKRFLQTLYYYQFSGPKPRFSTHQRFKIKDFSKNPKIIEIICYCLMPNHFHFLIRQTKDGGVQEFIRKVINSYTKYYNVKHNRVGHLFQGIFKATLVENNEQLLHLSRYIHLNPYVSDLTDDLEHYYYSSYRSFIGLTEDILCIKEPILELFESANGYKNFVCDHGDYAKELEQLKHLLIDPD